MTVEEATAKLEAAEICSEADQVEVFDDEIRARMRLAGPYLNSESIRAAFGAVDVTTSDYDHGCDTCGYGTTCYVVIKLK